LENPENQGQKGEIFMDWEELKEIALKEQAKEKKVCITCCSATGCIASDSEEVYKQLEEAVKARGLSTEVEVRKVGCLGLCGNGPLVKVSPQDTLYQEVTPDQAGSIVAALNGETPIAQQFDLSHPFFSAQLPIVTENSGKIDPEQIESYIAVGGYESLHKVLYEMTPQDVVQEVAESGLRGRGGGGYPTGLKWQTVAKMPGKQKYVICNADEGDPGAFMDRSVLESDPHRILEAMTIAGYAIGANHGYIYVRAEYPLAIKRLNRAIQQAKKYGLLGSQIFDSGFDFKIDIRIGAGAFVCGEETALIASIEGKRGNPRPRPPYPAQSGLWGCPTLINNVETYGNIPVIIRNGGKWFAGIGTEKSTGTKVFALTGKLKNSGLIEVPMGITLRKIVEDIGGGVIEGGFIKAVQTGGPSGGCIPASDLDTPVDYESLQQHGTIMGSGGMIVIDDKTNMVDFAKFYMEFCRDESCGKCIPCRAGTVQMYALLEKIMDGKATMADLAILEELGPMVKAMSLCGLGQTAPNPVLSTLRYFREEYLALIK
jgi:bidirectional [NiFe] hydrogenase diaphorase subunit